MVCGEWCLKPWQGLCNKCEEEQQTGDLDFDE